LYALYDSVAALHIGNKSAEAVNQLKNDHCLLFHTIQLKARFSSWVQQHVTIIFPPSRKLRKLHFFAARPLVAVLT